MRFVIELLEFIAIVWVVRFVLNQLLGGGAPRKAASHFETSGPANASPSPQPGVITGEMKKDPQCGTYVSTELSLKSRYAGEVVHFCSRQCQEEFSKAREQLTGNREQ